MSETLRDSCEAEPFIDEKSTDCDEPRPKTLAAIRWWGRIPGTTKFFIHLLMVLLNAGMFIAIICNGGKGVVHPNNALRNLSLRWKPTKTITAGMSPYAGGPGSDVDDAWHELMGNISVRVDQSELNRNGNHQTSVELPEGGGSLAWLSVFHQLHCLKMLRQLNYKDYYYPNQTESEARDQEVHLNHCIENLRQSIMCYPDTSLTTFVWTHSDPKPVLDVRRFERQCVDWEMFMENVAPRVVSYEEVNDLENPLLDELAH